MPNQIKGDPRVQYLRKSENFHLLSEIYELYPKVIEALHIEFWIRLADELATVLKAHPGWVLERAPDKAPGDKYFAFTIHPSETEKTKLYSSIAVEQQKASDSSSVPLIYGVCWSDDQLARKLRDGAAEKLCAELLKREFRTSSWWLGFKQLWDLRGRNTLEKLAEGNGSFESGLARDIGQLIDEVGKLIIDTNRQTGAMK